jgi:predicted nucleic-acid-binding Zn-ribbon protein
MTNGECSKCGSHEVYATGSLGHQAGIILSFWRVEYLTYLVCTKCGYTESYIFGKDSLDRIAKKGQLISFKPN